MLVYVPDGGGGVVSPGGCGSYGGGVVDDGGTQISFETRVTPVCDHLA